MYIYCIVNKTNGMKYVGLTTETIQKRFRRHLSKSRSDNKQYLHNAISKYGEENFIIYQLDEATSKEELIEKEQHWIKELNTRKCGYNETDGGEGSWNRVISEETKNKHRNNANHRYTDPSFKEKISETTKIGMKKWWESLTEQEKQEYIDKCKKRPEGYVPRKGFTHSEEVRKKMSEARKGKKRKPFTDEHRENLKKSRQKNKDKYIGKNNPMANEEYRNKVSQSKLGRKRVYQPDGTFKYVFPDNLGT